MEEELEVEPLPLEVGLLLQEVGAEKDLQLGPQVLLVPLDLVETLNLVEAFDQRVATLLGWLVRSWQCFEAFQLIWQKE